MTHQTKKQGFVSMSVKIFYFFFFAFILFNLVKLFSFSQDPEENKPKTFREKFRDDYNIYALDLPDSLEFCGEPVPMHNFDVREGLDQELLINTYWQSHTFLLIKRANRFFQYFVPILKQNDIPEDFKYLAVVESSLEPLAVSPSGAVGLWQFMEATAKEYDLEISSQVDERYHFKKSTFAACQYFRESYEKYQNWTLTAASYNCGKNGVDRQIERQKEYNFYDLLLPEETMRYIYRILALKIIMQDPEKYGFHYREEDLYPRVSTISLVIDSSVTDFAALAKSYGTNYMILKKFNPWLRQTYLRNPSGKVYRVEVPERGYRNINTILKPEEVKPNTID